MGKKKFKVGDKVKVNKGCWDLPENLTGIVVEVNSGTGKNMLLCKFEGFNGHNGNGHTISGENYESNDHWYVLPKDIRKVQDKSKSIVIYRKGNETIALDKTTGEKAVAKCSPEDEYDFLTGADLAFTRLVNKQAKERLKKNREYYNGYVECVEGAPKGTFPLPMTEGKIYEVKDGVLIYDDETKSFESKTLYQLQNYCGHYLKEVRLVERQAEVGEHIFITNALLTHGKYKDGDVLTVKNNGKNGVYVEEHSRLIFHEEYKVIEGYEPIKKLYNGKVVCIENRGGNVGLYTVGKIYHFIDGTVKTDTGSVMDNGGEKFYSFEEWQKFSSSKWIELVE